MKKSSGIAAFFIFFVLGTFLFSATASAYIDPSTMTFIVQVIAGIVIASGAAVGFFFKRLKRKFKKDEKSVNNAAAEEQPVNFENDKEFDDSHITEEEMNKLNGEEK